MNVLVLCHGNRYRSPLCAALVHAERPAWLVCSAGLGPGVRGKIPPLVRQQARAWQAPLLCDRSQPCTVDLVHWADCIVYMSPGNRRRLEQLAPTALNRAVSLATVAPGRRVPDPAFAREKGELFEVLRLATLALLPELDRRAAALA